MKRTPALKSLKGKKKPRAKKDRIPFNEAVLADRMGLNDDWIRNMNMDDDVLADCMGLTDDRVRKRWNETYGEMEESLAPFKLPSFIRQFEKGKIKEIETYVRRLVKAGCCERVIYFCLEQLSPEAERHRIQGELAVKPRPKVTQQEIAISPKAGSSDEEEIRMVRVQFDPDEEDMPEDTVPWRFAPGEKLEAVTNSAGKARKLIHQYRRDLWFAANATDRAGLHLPHTSLTAPEDNEDALELLEKPLAWASRLAEVYIVPYMKKLLEDKGVLYLVSHVAEHAEARKIRGHAHGNIKNALSALVDSVADKGWESPDLREKLRIFEKEYPRLYRLLVKKLDELHRFHSTQ